MSIVWINLLAESEVKAMDLVLLAGVVMVIAALLMRIRKRRKRAVREGTPREQLERLRQQSGMRGDLERLMVEIEQLAKRLGAQLDAKTMQLEKSMREAEEVISRLESAQGVDVTAAPPAPRGSSLPGREADLDPFTRSVCDLADQGLSARDIAGRLDEHIGKVELVLSLRKV